MRTGSQSAPESAGDPVVAMLAEVTRAALEPPLHVERAATWDRVEQQLEGMTRRGRRRWWAFGAATLCGATALILVLAQLPVRERALTLELVGGVMAENGSIRTTPAIPATLRFSDGTRITLAPGALARVASVSSRGASVRLEKGHVSLSVVPRPAAQWELAAGPFRLEVKGTAFEVQWSPEEGRLVVDLDHGVVVVSGRSLATPFVMRGKQHLTVAAHGHEVTIGDGGQLQPAAADEPPAVSTAAFRRAPAKGAPAARPSWPSLLADGKSKLILDEANRLGVDFVLAHHPGADLAALADAARYDGKPDLARRALLAERRRFAGSTYASEAAFLLGRLDEDGRSNDALVWYDRYLGEAPSGPYASEVLGRKMVVVRQLEGGSKARPVAEEYLRRFPNGSYAELARKVLAPRN